MTQELSKIDGVVTKVAKSAEDLQSNEPYLVVKGSGGVVIQGKVSEMNLDKLTSAQPSASTPGKPARWSPQR